MLETLLPISYFFLIVQSPSHNFINRPFCKKLHHGVSKLKATTNKIPETMKFFSKTKQTKRIWNDILKVLLIFMSLLFDWWSTPRALVVRGGRRPRRPLSKNVPEVSLLLLQVHRINYGEKKVQPSVVIVIAIRLFLICLNFFIFLVFKFSLQF